MRNNGEGAEFIANICNEIHSPPSITKKKKIKKTRKSLAQVFSALLKEIILEMFFSSKERMLNFCPYKTISSCFWHKQLQLQFCFWLQISQLITQENRKFSLLLHNCKAAGPVMPVTCLHSQQYRTIKREFGHPTRYIVLHSVP